MSRVRRRTATLLQATIEAQAATWATLSARVPALLDGTASSAERTRMVREKAEAAVESAYAVGRTAMRLSSRPALTPGMAWSNWLSLAEAATRPYHKRVKANAKRLGRTRKHTSG